jgi:hypothetical protein
MIGAATIGAMISAATIAAVIGSPSERIGRRRDTH